MILKWIGAVLIVLGSGGFGFSLAAAHRREERNLQQLIFGLDYMQCELQYQLAPLPTLCRKTARQLSGVMQTLFLNLAEVLEDQNDEEAWPETVDASYFFGNDPIEVDGEMLDPHALHLNPVYYADKSIIDRCALMHDAGESQEMLLEMWNEIKLAR